MYMKVGAMRINGCDELCPIYAVMNNKTDADTPVELFVYDNTGEAYLFGNILVTDPMELNEMAIVQLIYTLNVDGVIMTNKYIIALNDDVASWRDIIDMNVVLSEETFFHDFIYEDLVEEELY